METAPWLKANFQVYIKADSHVLEAF